MLKKSHIYQCSQIATVSPGLVFFFYAEGHYEYSIDTSHKSGTFVSGEFFLILVAKPFGYSFEADY